MSDKTQARMIQDKKEALNKLIIKLQKRVAMVLKEPSRNDPIYQCLHRLVNDNAQYHLGRNKKIRFKLRHLARKRFYLGYPPRKDKDNSLGDAINWEWIIQCAADSNKDIIIVSRDSDYGVEFEDEYILNDWLKYEFKKRISQKRQIILTKKLSAAFKLIGIKITNNEEKLENQLIRQSKDEEANDRHFSERIRLLDLLRLKDKPTIIIEGNDAQFEGFHKNIIKK